MSKKIKKWSQKVTENSHALSLENRVFAWSSPKKIADSLRKSALKSRNRKSSAFRSAMSMLCFYINRAGKKLPENKLNILNKAKQELRKLFNREKPKNND